MSRRVVRGAATVALVAASLLALQLWRHKVVEEVSGFVVDRNVHLERPLIELPIPIGKYRGIEIVARRSIITLQLDSGKEVSMGCRYDEVLEYRPGQRVTIKRRPNCWVLSYWWL